MLTHIKLNKTNIALLLQEATQNYRKLRLLNKILLSLYALLYGFLQAKPSWLSLLAYLAVQLLMQEVTTSARLSLEKTIGIGKGVTVSSISVISRLHLLHNIFTNTSPSWILLYKYSQVGKFLEIIQFNHLQQQPPKVFRKEIICDIHRKTPVQGSIF